MAILPTTRTIRQTWARCALPQHLPIGVSPENLAEEIPFTFTDGNKGHMTREERLTHVALHGGCHSGEVGRIFWQLSVRPPSPSIFARPSLRRDGKVSLSPFRLDDRSTSVFQSSSFAGLRRSGMERRVRWLARLSATR